MTRGTNLAQRGDDHLDRSSQHNCSEGIGRNLYLDPTVDLVQHTYTSRTGVDYRERLVNFGLGMLFQFGR